MKATGKSLHLLEIVIKDRMNECLLNIQLLIKCIFRTRTCKCETNICILSREAANSNCTFFSITRPGFEPTYENKGSTHTLRSIS